MKTIGVLGAGQLGRMLALAGLPLEMKFQFFDTSGSPSVGLEPTYIETDSPTKAKHSLSSWLTAMSLLTNSSIFHLN